MAASSVKDAEESFTPCPLDSVRLSAQTAIVVNDNSYSSTTATFLTESLLFFLNMKHLNQNHHATNL